MSDNDVPTEFYEDDEPIEEILAAFESGEKGVTAPPSPWSRLGSSEPAIGRAIIQITAIGYVGERSSRDLGGVAAVR